MNRARSERIAAPWFDCAQRIPLVIATALFVAACGSEHTTDPLAPEMDAEPRTVALECTADVVRGTLECAAPATGLPSGARGALTLGGQGINVLLASSNVCFEDQCDPDVPAGVFQAEVTVTNLIGQALGTVDGENVHEDGVRVFFSWGPVVTATTDDLPGTAVVHNADGVGLFTASDQPYFQYGEVLGPNETSAAKTWQWLLSSNVQSFQFGVLVSAEVQHPEGWIDVTPAVDTLVVGDPEGGSTLQLAAVVRDRLGAVVEDEEVSWTSSDEAKATVDENGLVTAVAGEGWVTVTATAGPRSGTAEIYLSQYIAALNAEHDAFPIEVLGNVSISSGASAFNVLANDVLTDGAQITFVGWLDDPGKTLSGGDVSMTTSGDGMGEFTYNPPAGFEGSDFFLYELSDGSNVDTAVVYMTVTGMVWFIDNNAPECTSVAAGCGRLSNPFSSLDAFATANDNAENHPGDGDVIFIYESDTNYTISTALTLRWGQKLVGQDATESLEQIVGGSAPVGSPPLPSMDAANGTRVRIAGSAGGIVLGTNNTLRGLTISTTGGTGIEGDGFGTLTLGGDVEVATTNGPAIDLANGKVDGAFRSVSASGGVNGIVLSNTTGTFEVTGSGTVGSGGTIQGTTGDGILLTNTETVSLAWMSILGNGANGIRGDTVGGLHLRRTSVIDNGDEADEHGLRFTQLTGTARIDTVQIRGSNHDEVFIANSSGTLDLYMYGNDITNPAPEMPTGLFEAGVRILPTGDATINTELVGNTIGNHAYYNFYYVPDDNGGGTVSVTNNQFGTTNGYGVYLVGGTFGSMWSGVLDYTLSYNTITNAVGFAVTVGALGLHPDGQARGSVLGNIIGTPGDPESCGLVGIKAHGNGFGQHITSITYNELYQCGSQAITVTAEDGWGYGRHDVVVQGNTVTMSQVEAPGALSPESFYAMVNTSVMCLAAGHPANPSLKNSLDHRVDKATDHDLVVGLEGSEPALILEGYQGNADDLVAAATFLSNSNTFRGSGTAKVSVDATNSYFGESITGGACNRP